MPVLKIMALPPPPEVDVTAVLSATCVELARVAGVPAHAIWATFLPLAPAHYVEGETAATGAERDTHPPLVELIAFEGRSDALIAAMLETTARCLAEGFRLEPGNVYVSFTEAPSGRVHTGGHVRRRP